MKRLLLLTATLGMLLAASPAMSQEEVFSNCPPGTTAVEGGCLLEDGTVQTPEELFACEGLGPGTPDERLIACGVDDPTAYRAQLGPQPVEPDPLPEAPELAGQTAPAPVETPGTSETMTVLPETGGPLLVIPAAGLLAGAAFLGLRVLRNR